MNNAGTSWLSQRGRTADIAGRETKEAENKIRVSARLLNISPSPNAKTAVFEGRDDKPGFDVIVDRSALVA